VATGVEPIAAKTTLGPPEGPPAPPTFCSFSGAHRCRAGAGIAMGTIDEVEHPVEAAQGQSVKKPSSDLARGAREIECARSKRSAAGAKRSDAPRAPEVRWRSSTSD
jgi:hypothetical protein